MKFGLVMMLVVTSCAAPQYEQRGREAAQRYGEDSAPPERAPFKRERDTRKDSVVLKRERDAFTDIESVSVESEISCLYVDRHQRFKLSADALRHGEEDFNYYALSGRVVAESWLLLRDHEALMLVGGERWRVPGQHRGSVLRHGGVFESVTWKFSRAQLESMSSATSVRWRTGLIECELPTDFKKALTRLLEETESEGGEDEPETETDQPET